MRNKRRLTKQFIGVVLLLWMTVCAVSFLKPAVSDTEPNQWSSDDYLNPYFPDKEPPAVEHDPVVMDLPVTPARNRSKSKILILSPERAGSSFIGEILRQLPGAYYSVDALYFLQFGIENNTFIQDFLLGKNASHYLGNLLHCKFKPILAASEKYFPKENVSRKDWSKNAFPGGNTVEQAMSVCENRSKVMAKVTNVRYIKHVMSLLEDPLTTVIYLVRDPRGIMNSIIKADNVNHHGQLYYNQTSNLQQKVKTICDPLLANLKYLKASLPQRGAANDKSLFVLRFEDVAYHPRTAMINLFRYFGAEPNQALFDWLVNITTSSAYSRNPFSTIRESSKVAEAWRDDLSYGQVKVIQEECAHVLWEYGYWAAKNTDVLRDKRKSLVDVLPNHLLQLS